MNLDLGDTQRIIREAKRQGVTLRQLAYILATARWETNHTMKPVREAYWLSEAWRKKNLRYYPWYGRGYVQLTWERNYKHAGVALDRDLTSNPDVVMEPQIAAEILVSGSMNGWFTGKRISDYINGQNTDYVNARRVINGTDKAHTIAQIAEQYQEALEASGYSLSKPIPAPTPAKPSQSPWAALIAALVAFFKGGKT